MDKVGVQGKTLNGNDIMDKDEKSELYKQVRVDNGT